MEVFAPTGAHKNAVMGQKKVRTALEVLMETLRAPIAPREANLLAKSAPEILGDFASHIID